MAVSEAKKSDRPFRTGKRSELVVIGAGPAGLTAAVEAGRLGFHAVVVEKNAIVGGLARTEQYKGFLFDLGGHRFFTKVEWVDAWWREMLGGSFLRRSRLSRIIYGGKFFSYPPSFFNAISGLGLVEGLRIAFSYLQAQLFPTRPVVTFKNWVSNNFGARLFSIFFESYTEKVWGISCSELRAEWAAQRIKNMSLRTIIRSMLLKTRRKVTSLIEEFDYPSEGPGMMWRAAADRVEAQGGQVFVRTELMRFVHSDGYVQHVDVREGERVRSIKADAFVSTLPLPELIAKLAPAPPVRVRNAAAQLRFRDFLTVCLVVDAPSLFPDNWIYVHEPKVKVARIQNFKNWSPHMVPDAGKTSLGLEYFCNRNDDIWKMADAELVKLAVKELALIGLVHDIASVVDGCVFRVANAYPIYDEEYADAVGVIRGYLDTFANLRTAGRNGLHRYNNQDHSMLAGRLAARELLLGEHADLWTLNTEEEYLEQKPTSHAGPGLRRAVDDDEAAAEMISTP